MYPLNLTGHTLGGRYRIDEQVGKGGMSAVYKAYDPNLKRTVAIKLIHPHLADEAEFLGRFKEEAAAVANLRHPNIVQVYDFNHDNGIYYMVQEFLPGETLQERLRRLNQSGQRMSSREAIAFTIQICQAAEFAHQRGMIHRDIKPANIMLDFHNQAILMDFGIVKIVGSDRHTASGAVFGTAQYMPPEMIRGEPPDRRSDIYSLGITLFEMVSGRPPYEASSAMTLMMMHVNDAVPDLRTLDLEVPEELIQIIERAMAKDRNQRFQSMAEMAASLSRVLERIDSGIALYPNATQASVPVIVQAAQTERLSQTGSRPAVSPAVALPPVPATQRTGETGAAPTGTGALPAGAQRKRIPAYLWIGGAAGLLLFALLCGSLGAWIFLSTRQDAKPTTAVAIIGTVSATETQLPPTSTNTPTTTALPSATPTATSSPTPHLSPTPTFPSGVPFAAIQDVTIDEQGNYAITYETFEFSESLSGLHLIFMYNTQTSDLGYMYGGPRPFSKFEASSRPKDATQLCVLVANADHTPRPDSGNCVFLPDVVAAAPYSDTACLQGPDNAFPSAVGLSAGQVTVVRGLSADEAWWSIVNPENLDESCWLAKEDSLVTGDISVLPLIEPPVQPGDVAASQMFAEITGITVDNLKQYNVSFNASGFDPALPGHHIHFFFDTVSSDQVGISGSGNRLMFGGPSPFTGFSVADQPPNAQQICALAANPDHSVLANSGNCYPLPATSPNTPAKPTKEPKEPNY